MSEGFDYVDYWQKRGESLQTWINDNEFVEFGYTHEGLIAEQRMRYETAAELRRLHLVNQELVKVLKSLIDMHKIGIGTRDWGYLFKMAEAAIAKARGEG